MTHNRAGSLEVKYHTLEHRARSYTKMLSHKRLNVRKLPAQNNNDSLSPCKRSIHNVRCMACIAIRHATTLSHQCYNSVVPRTGCV